MMTDSKFNTDWKKALGICESITDLSESDKYKHILSLDIEEDVKNKALKIINRLDEENDLLDENNCSIFIKDIEENKDLVGQKIDNYKLVKKIAKGGMSSIYEAIMIDSEVQNHVAIKILSPYMYSQKSLELFKREQIILSQLKHPNIISFHHNGQTEDGMQYLVMEYLENAKNIVQYADQENLDINAIVKLIRQIADVCQYTHNNLIIHRDIKADNVLIDESGRLRVIDFGIGQYETSQNSEATQVFTLDTASPEQILGENVTVQTDVFSLGALLLQLLVKQKPLPKTNARQYDPKEDEAHVNLLLSNSSLDKDLKNIVKQAMHIDISQRYSSMSDFAKDLENWQNKLPVNATADSIIYRISKFYARNKLPTILGVSVILIIIFSALFIYHTDSKLQSEISKKQKSLEIIKSVFQQSNPLNKQMDESTLTAGFEHIKIDQGAMLDADPELKFLIYSEMAGLYQSNNFYQKSLENTEQSLQTLALFARPTDPRFINSEAQLIRILSSNGDYQKSIELAGSLIARLDVNNPEHVKALIIANLTSAQSHYILTDTNQANKFLDKCYTLIELFEDKNVIDEILRADVYNLSAVIHKSQGNFDLATQAYQKSIQLLRKTKHGKKDLAINLTNFGVLKIEEDNFVDAEKYLLEAKQIIEELDKNHTQIAVINIQYSSLLRLQKRYDEAEKVLVNSLPILKKANDKRQLIWIYSGLTSFSLYNNEIGSALSNFEQGFELSINIYGFDHPQTIRLLNKFAGIASISAELFDLDAMFEKIDSQLTENVYTSQDYEDYEILRAIHQKTKFINKYKLSHITEYLFDPTITSNEERQKWLLKNHNIKETDKVLNGFIQLWMQEFSVKEQEYIEACSKSDDWSFTYIYPLKAQFLDLCMATGKRHGFEINNANIKTAEYIESQINNNQTFIKEIIANL